MRKALVAALAAAFVGVPAVPSYATIDHCPAGVAGVSGHPQATYAEIDGWLTAAAAKHDVPLSILRVIAYKESTWRQFASNGGALVSGDATCGLGLMQVTADTRDDAVRLAEDGAYNADVGAGILREKWELSQTTPPPTGYDPDDPDVIENWYYAICLYNGCDGSSDAYAADAAKYLHDPFRYLPADLRTFLRPAGFTKPSDAKPTYVFPGAFQARTTASGGEFVFYDHTTGAVIDVVPARVHLVSAPPVVSYPAFSLGPDSLGVPPVGPFVTCVQCGGWRLWEGAGRSGRAHWTNTVTGAAQSKVTWQLDTGGGTARYRIDAFVPALGDETLGHARYTLSGYGSDPTTVTIDQNATKGTWVPLATRSFSGSPTVTLADTSDVAGVKIVADAVRAVPQPALTIALDGSPYTTFGDIRGLRLSLQYGNGDPVRYRYVKVYRRLLGTTAWQGIGTWRTSESGFAEALVKPDRNYEYTARFDPAPGDYLVAAASGIVRHYVRPKVVASFTNNSPLSGDATTLRTSVLPHHAGHVVRFQRWISGYGWYTDAYGRLDTYGRAYWTFRPTLNAACGATRSYRFRVYKPADYDHVESASEPVELLVHARCP